MDNTTLPKRGEPGFHRLQKVKGLFDIVRGRFMVVYYPSCCLSVDEAVIAFKGEFCHSSIAWKMNTTHLTS